VWLRAEIAWAGQDWQIAEAHAQRLQLLSLRAENEHLRSIAYLLQAQICAAQGKDTEAQTQLRLMKAHEAQLRNENLNSCDDLLNRQLRAATAGKTLRLGRVPLHPGLFVHQDSLTSLYNRRYLEQAVPGILAKGVERRAMPAMVFVDVNAFRQINDRLSRSVGDAVLKALAHVLNQFVGEGDVLARLGGDEFVLVLAQVDAGNPRALMARIRAAVAQHAWGRIHAELAVQVSCVLTLADPYDTLDSWLHRCELSMYIEKDARHHKLT
jgi:diguanylate cyclase (GGDEF)-like protein